MNKKTVILLVCPVMLLLMSLKAAFIPSQVKKPLTDSLKRPTKFGFGRPATAQEIAVWDIDVRPDGKGLPVGQGDVKKGKLLYAQKCAMCHGDDGREKPGVKLPGAALVGDTSATSKAKTIGNYWPYATTLFDYMRRAMPYNLPGSLSNNEVYSLTAYLLSANKIIKDDVVLDAKNLYKVVMPAKKLFIMDNRKGGPEIK
ncbi:cytochrome c [Pedobacter psychrodurus]|uniref:c-type cytochrome n=1 Tax=Pedobacter psychrodurus TaxID=2530456 RepID=UPI0029311A46|nr:cytochrome c [Pedobacter psychrodurus]